MVNNKEKQSETKTENIFREFYGTNSFLEKSAIPNEYNFKSKKKTNSRGYPDFFKHLVEEDFIILVECKAKESNHEEAIEELKHYMKSINKQFNVWGIACSGQNLETIKIDNFISLKSTSKIEDAFIKELIPIEEIIQNFNNLSLKIDYKNLMTYKNKLNDIFDQKFKLDVKNRPFFFAALLFSLDELEKFLSNIKINKISKGKIWSELNEFEKINFLNNLILLATEKKLKKSSKNINKITHGLSKFQFIKENDYIESKIYLEFIKKFVEVFSNYKKTSKYYDIVGNFYTEFLRYVQKDGGQDIVLTPDHIKVFMVKLLNIQYNDVILDTCTGTAGFLATSFGFIIDELEKENKRTQKNINKVKEKQLIGIEKSIELFPLAFSNMVLHGDGKSNLFKGDCFDNFMIEKNQTIEELIEKLKPTKGIINPPYNDNQAPVFIKRLLDLLNLSKSGKLACIIAPSNCFVKNPNNINEKIFKENKLLKIIKLNEKLFTNQNIAAHTSIYLFRTGEKHEINEPVYFYDFSNDNFHYSKRKMEDMGDFKELLNVSLNDIMNNKIIEGKSYLQNLDYRNSKDIQFIKQSNPEIKMNDLVEKVLDFEIFKLRRKDVNEIW